MNLMPNEQVVRRAKAHWIWLLSPTVFTFCGFCFTLATVTSSFSETSQPNPPPQETIRVMTFFSGCWLIAGFLLVMLVLLAYLASEITLTNKRLVIKHGILNRSTQEFPLIQIESLRLEEPLVGRMLGYGTIIITGTGGINRTLRRIDGASQLVSQTQSQIAQLGGHRIH